jgi:hypothetical protein
MAEAMEAETFQMSFQDLHDSPSMCERIGTHASLLFFRSFFHKSPWALEPNLAPKSLFHIDICHIIDVWPSVFWPKWIVTIADPTAIRSFQIADPTAIRSFQLLSKVVGTVHPVRGRSLSRTPLPTSGASETLQIAKPIFLQPRTMATPNSMETVPRKPSCRKFPLAAMNPPLASPAVIAKSE